MSRECQILRVFTRGELGGNHLGVVTDVAGLTTGLMARAIVLFAASILALGLVTLYVSREEEQ